MEINMNFNFEKLKKFILPAVIVVLLIICGFNCTYQVKEQEKAILLTFGNAKTVSESGLHFKIPFVQSVRKVNTTIQGFPIGYVTATKERVEEESLMITNDFNFVNVGFFVEYQVTDPVKMIYSSQDPVSILKNLAQSCIRTEIGSSKVDDVLTTGKNKIQAGIKEMIGTKLEKFDIGISLINITIQDAEPPTTDVMVAFKAVETAKQGKDTALNNAEKYKNEKVPAAEAEVDKILQEAASHKEARINEAKGQVARFEKMYTEYKKFPEVTKQRLFYETMEELLPNLKVVIDSGSGKSKNVLILGQDLLKDTSAQNSADTNTDTQSNTNTQTNTNANTEDK